jgi:RNA polymerase sigma-70 factor (ECF subfamily)
MTPADGGAAAVPGQISRTAMFEDLYEKYRNQLYACACYLTQNRREAEDLFQETWLRIARHADEIKSSRDAKDWILAVAANLHRDNLRKRRVRRLFFAWKPGFSEHELEMAESPWGGRRAAGDSAEQAEQAEAGRAIDKALAKLPDRQRRIFVLKEIEGLKQSEVSEALGVPVGTIKSLLFRAVKQLRRDLKDYDPGKTTWQESEPCGAKTPNV